MNPTVLKFSDAKDDQTCNEVCSGPRDGSEVVFIDPSIWSQSAPNLGCVPPCTFILPPETLVSATTISIAPVTETMEETWPSATRGGTVIYGTKTVTTVITIPAITTTVIEYSNIVWDKTQGVSTTDITFWYSIRVPGVTLTDKDHPEITWTYSLGPWPTGTMRSGGVTSTTEGGSGTTTDDDGSGTTTKGNGGSTTDHPPPSATRTTIPASSGSAKPTCTSDGCGHPCRVNCDTPPGVKPPPGIDLPCIGLGCGSNSNGGSSQHNCVGSGCSGGGGGGDGGDEDGDEDGGFAGTPAPADTFDKDETEADPDWASMSSEQAALATQIWDYWDSLYPEPTTTTPEPPLKTTYDCDGSGNCGTILQVKYCDHAINSLQRNDDQIYGTKYVFLLESRCPDFASASICETPLL